MDPIQATQGHDHHLPMLLAFGGLAVFAVVTLGKGRTSESGNVAIKAISAQNTAAQANDTTLRTALARDTTDYAIQLAKSNEAVNLAVVNGKTATDIQTIQSGAQERMNSVNAGAETDQARIAAAERQAENDKAQAVNQAVSDNMVTIARIDKGSSFGNFLTGILNSATSYFSKGALQAPASATPAPLYTYPVRRQASRPTNGGYLQMGGMGMGG